MVKLQDELHRAERYSKVFSVAMADIDRFKTINDTYGHTTGDQVLKAAGEFLQESIRQTDVIARYGGEEFVIFFPEADKKSASVLAERLRVGFSKIKLDNLPKLTISIGVASYPEDGKDIGNLIDSADAAMYTAKKKGRNRVVIYQ
jgi:diguanylate cyclase (GGDEF)-like protein